MASLLAHTFLISYFFSLRESKELAVLFFTEILNGEDIFEREYLVSSREIHWVVFLQCVKVSKEIWNLLRCLLPFNEDGLLDTLFQLCFSLFQESTTTGCLGDTDLPIDLLQLLFTVFNFHLFVFFLSSKFLRPNFCYQMKGGSILLCICLLLNVILIKSIIFLSSWFFLFLYVIWLFFLCCAFQEY